MKKERRNMEEIDRFIGETFGVSPAKSSNEQTAAEFPFGTISGKGIRERINDK